MTKQTEAAFLAQYNKDEFETPIFSIDSVLFTYHEEQLKVLMVKRANHPDQGKWGLPGGFVDLSQDHTLEEAVLRKLKEKTGIKPPYIEQLKTYGNQTRDKRGWSITCCYSALMAHQDCQSYIESVDDAQWVALEVLHTIEIAFDHAILINDARERLKQKALYSIIAGYALPKTFTLSELQQLHELLIGKPIQRKSFRRRIEQAGLLIDTQKKRSDGGRPAKLYQLKACSADFTFLRNLEE